MSGTQGSSYGSSGAAAAGNRQVTSNLKSGLNPSGSSKTSSGYGSRPASSSVNAAAANAARMAAQRAATSSAGTRNLSGGAGASLGGFGSAREVASRMGAGGGLSSNTADKTGLPGIGSQAFGKGTNYSAADYTMAGYGAYKNPNARQQIVDKAGNQIASLAAPRQNITTVSKGINLSPADMLRGGYGQYQQAPAAPSAQSTPQTAVGGWNELAGLQRAVAGMNPSLGNIVAGTTGNPLGKVTSNGEIGEVTGPAGEATFNRAMANMLPAMQKDQSRVPSAPSGPSPSMTAAAGYRDYDPVSELSTPQTAPPSQVAGYQNPARAFPSRPAAAPAPSQIANNDWNGSPNIAAANAAAMNTPMNVNYQQKTAMQGLPGAPAVASVPSLPNYAPPVSVANREPEGYSSPNAAPTQTVSYQNPARAFPTISRPAMPTQSAMVSPMAGNGQTFRSPASAAQYNQAMGGLLSAANNQVASADPVSGNDPLNHPLYEGDSTIPQKINAGLETRFEKIAAPVQKAGEYVNGLLGGNDYNDLYGRPGMTDPNARSTTNYESENEQSRKSAMKGLTDEQRKKVKDYMKDGMSRKEAIAKVKAESGTGGTGGSGGGTTPTKPSVYYPQYYSTWAGLPSGQKYG